LPIGHTQCVLQERGFEDNVQGIVGNGVEQEVDIEDFEWEEELGTKKGLFVVGNEDPFDGNTRVIK